MLKRWRNELNQFILIAVIGGVAGWTIGFSGWGIAIVLACYCYWLLIRLKELIQWVEANDESEAPESGGVWGDLFDTLNHQKKLTIKTRENLEEILRRAQESTNAIDEAIVVTSESGSIQWFNKSAYHLLGLRRDTDFQNQLTNLIRDPRFVRFFNRGKFENTIELTSPRNPELMLQLSVTVFGQNQDRLVLARDITRVHSLVQMRKDFVANVSHELRTPLTVIKGYLETFLDSMDPSSQRALYRGLEQMNQQSIRMELIVSDLLLLSKLETDDAQTTTTMVNVPQLLKQVYNDALAMNEEKNHNIVLKADPGINIMGVENELRSAFSNLVVNAVKYTPENGDIEIRWWLDGKGVHMSVSDSGIGIDARHIPRLTERFYRADPSRHSKTGGTGLGLAIVKHVMLHHEATLEIKSELNRGSEFICHFPVSSAIKEDSAEASIRLSQTAS